MTRETKIGVESLVMGFVLGCVLMLLVMWPSPPPSAPKVYANATVQMVMVRGNEWAVLFGSEDPILDLAGFYGITDCAHQKIYIHGSLNMANQRDSVLHEILHAGTCDEAGNSHNRFYNSDTDAGHEGIYKIADFMSTLLHDNPELAIYFSGETK